jgi:hypothetical protein
MYIAGTIATHSLTEASGTYSPADPADSVILAHLVSVYGGAIGDYSIVHLADAGSDALRVMAGDEFVTVWDGDVLTGIDFAPEDAKKWVRCTVDKSQVCFDSRRASIVSVEVWLADKSAIDTAYAGELRVPCRGPTGFFYMAFRALSGRGAKTFLVDEPGTYIFGSSEPDGMRLDVSATFNVCA